MFAKYINGFQVNNTNELIMKASIDKHVEFSWIDIKFSDQFQVINILDNVIINMVDNIDDRLQLIRGSEHFIIVRNISNNSIFKSMIDKNGDN